MASKAWAGSKAAVIGLPITKWLDPAAIAWAGVNTRCWSPKAEPAGRMPGVTRAKG